MSRVPVDTSIWIEYFRDSRRHSVVDELIIGNIVCTNDLILAELIPAIQVRREKELIESLLAITRYELEIDWNQIIQMQVTNIEHGLNRVGIPDLIIIENVLANDLILFTADRHFKLMQRYFSFMLYKE